MFSHNNFFSSLNPALIELPQPRLTQGRGDQEQEQLDRAMLQAEVMKIEADAQDYGIVYHLIHEIFSRTYSPINQKSRELLKIIQDQTADLFGNEFKPFTVQNLSDWVGVSESSIRRRLRDLVYRGIVSEDKDKNIRDI